MTTTTSESSITLQWDPLPSDSLWVVVEVRRGGVMVRNVTVGRDEFSLTLSSLRPLTTYTFTLYVVNGVGRSISTSHTASTLSLSQSLPSPNQPHTLTWHVLPPLQDCPHLSSPGSPHSPPPENSPWNGR